MRIRPLALILVSAVLLLAGCTSPAAVPDPTTTADGEVSPSPSPSPEASERLVLSLDSLTYEKGEETEVVALADGEALVGLVEQIAGEGAEEEFDGPYDSEGGTRYRWDGLTISVWAYDSAAYVLVDGPSVGDVPIATTEGIVVGSTREEVIAAGAVELCTYDGDGDGLADSLSMQLTDVPDTQSLCRTGTVGVEFLDIGLTGDTVSRIAAPSNDFSDI